jgi:hypothetical protein
MTGEMFGGRHRNDEVNGARARCGQQKNEPNKTTRFPAGIGQDGEKVVVRQKTEERTTDLD